MQLKLNKSLFILVIIILLQGISLTGQTSLNIKDISLIKNHIQEDLKNQEIIYHKKRNFYLKGQPLIKKLNPISWVFGSLLYGYQNGLSIQFSADCLYHPSCSNFCKNCLEQYGLIKGLLLTSDRISRCNRISQSDLHPINFDEGQKRYIDIAEDYH